MGAIGSREHYTIFPSNRKLSRMHILIDAVLLLLIVEILDYLKNIEKWNMSNMQERS